MTDDDRRTVATQGGATPTPIGELPPLGVVPPKMHAQVVRQSRYGDPATAFAPEVVEHTTHRAGRAIDHLRRQEGMKALLEKRAHSWNGR